MKTTSIAGATLTANDLTDILGRNFHFYNSPLLSINDIDIDSIGLINEVFNDIGNEFLHRTLRLKG